jgi:hypothetical protein
MKLKLSAKQLRFILLGLLALSIVAFFALMVLGLKSLNAKSKELVDLKLKNKTLDAQLISLGVAKKQVEQYSYFNDVAKTVLPADKDQAKAVLTIFELAEEAKINIASITFPTSNLGGAAGSTSAAGSSSATAISQARPVEGISGLYSLQLTIVPETGPAVPAEMAVTYPKFLKFLKSIERDRRTAQITQVAVQPVTDQGAPSQALSFILVVNIFIKPAK